MFRIFFKFTNDNNPFILAKVEPTTLVDGLAVIGGYMGIFGVVTVLSMLLNRHFNYRFSDRGGSHLLYSLFNPYSQKTRFCSFET